MGNLDTSTIQSLISDRSQGTDPLVRSFLSAQSYQGINELRREILSQAGIVLSAESSTFYLSAYSALTGTPDA